MDISSSAGVLPAERAKRAQFFDALANARHTFHTRGVLRRKQLGFDQLADNMPDQIVRLLYSLGVIARHNQREITKRGHAPAVPPQQAYDSHSLLTRLLTR